MESENICALCRDGSCDFETRCRHHFHLECLKATKKSECPLCKGFISAKPLVEKYYQDPETNAKLLNEMEYDDIHYLVKVCIIFPDEIFEPFLKRLIELGWDVNEMFSWSPATKEEHTALLACIYHKNRALALKLIELGAKIVDGFVPFVRVISLEGYNDSSFMELLLEHRYEIGLDMDALAVGLYAAIKYGDFDIFKMLLAAGGKVETITSFQLAIFTGSCTEVECEEAEEVSGINLKQFTTEYANLLTVAAVGGNLDIIVRLVAIYPHLLKSDSWGALTYAADKGRFDIVDKLVELGANINVRNEKGQSCLMAACADSKIEMIDRLVKLGAEINVQDENGSTALQVACCCGRPEIAIFLVLAGANPFMRDRKNRMAIHWACISGCPTTIGMMLKHAYNPHFLRTAVSEVTLVEAAYIGATVSKRTAGLHTLINSESAIDFFTLNSSGEPFYFRIFRDFGLNNYRSPVAQAFLLDFLKLCEALHVDFNFINHEGLNVLGVFLKYSCKHLKADEAHVALQAVKFLVAHGCKMNLMDKSGRMPIHYVCENLEEGILEVFIENGVNIMSLTSNGETPFELALNSLPYDPIIGALEKLKANSGSRIPKTLRNEICNVCAMDCCSLKTRCGHTLHISCIKERGSCPVCKTAITPFDAIERFIAAWLDVKVNGLNSFDFASMCNCFGGASSTEKPAKDTETLAREADEYFKSGLKALNEKELLVLLIEACENSDIPYEPIFNRLLEINVPLEKLSSTKEYPRHILHRAVLYNRTLIPLTLIKLGRIDDFKTEDYFGNTIFHMACLSGNVSLVRLAAQTVKLDVNKPNAFDITPWHAALLVDNVEIIAECFDITPGIESDLIRKFDNRNIFMFAARNSSPKIIEYLQQTFSPPLGIFISSICRAPEIKFRSGFMVYDIIYYEKTSLAKIALIKKLLESENPDAAIDLEFVKGSLSSSAFAGDLELFDFLVSYLKDSLKIELDPENEPFNLLSSAASGENYEIFQKALEMGFDPNRIDVDGSTPLMACCRSAHPNLQIFKALMDLNVDVNIEHDETKETAFFTACKHGTDCIEILDELIKKGADVLVRDADGFTCLHVAVLGGSIEVVRKLLDLNVFDPNDINNKSNMSPLELALVEATPDEGKVLEMVKTLAPITKKQLREEAATRAYNRKFKNIFRYLKSMHN